PEEPRLGSDVGADREAALECIAKKAAGAEEAGGARARGGQAARHVGLVEERTAGEGLETQSDAADVPDMCDAELEAKLVEARGDRRGRVPGTAILEAGAQGEVASLERHAGGGTQARILAAEEPAAHEQAGLDVDGLRGADALTHQARVVDP